MAKGIPGKSFQVYLAVDPASGKDSLVTVVRMLNDKDAFLSLDPYPVFKQMRKLRRALFWRRVSRFFKRSPAAM